ncbi:MAG: hypothetical protein J5637_05835 [Prevotella sp.]|nr:hypothetical protein [Prevotella sp.]
MIKYFFKKYTLGIVIALVIFFSDYAVNHDFNKAMQLTVILGFLLWTAGLIIFMKTGKVKKGIRMISGPINFLKLVWYVVSLYPLRRLIRRCRYGTPTAQPYPFLALYGCILDTYAMKNKFSYALFHDKTTAVKATVWRLLARGILGFAYNANKQPGICVREWHDMPSSGLDQDFGHAIYNLLRQCAQPGTIISPDAAYKVITTIYAKNNYTGETGQQSLAENQFLLADLLNTGISLKAYSKDDVNHIFGMKRFLRHLPHSYNTTATPGTPEMRYIWREYMAYAYLFGMEKSTFSKICQMIPATTYQEDPLRYLLQNSEPHAKVVKDIMRALSDATLECENVVAASRGLLAAAWHVDEIYDI